MEVVYDLFSREHTGVDKDQQLAEVAYAAFGRLAEVQRSWPPSRAVSSE